MTLDNSRYPLTLSAIHMAFNYILSTIFLNCYGVHTKEFTQGYSYYRILLLSIIFNLNVVFGNAGLRYASVSLREVVRCIIPSITMGLSMLFLRKRYPVRVAVALLPIMCGVFCAAYGDIEFTWFGMIILLISSVLAAAKGVLTYKLMIGGQAIPPMVLLNLLAPLAMVQMIFLAGALGEFTAILRSWEAATEPITLLAVCTTGLMAFLLNWTNFHSSKESSPLTVSVAGSVKEVITISASFVLFNSALTLLNFVGIVLAIFGAAVYNYTNSINKEKQVMKMEINAVQQQRNHRAHQHV